MNGQNVKVVDKFNNLGVETYIYIYIYISNLQPKGTDVGEMVCETKTMYGIEVLGLSEAWKESDKVRSRFCKLLASHYVFGYRRAGKAVL